MQGKARTILGVVLALCIALSFGSSYMKLRALSQERVQVILERVEWESRLEDLQTMIEGARNPDYVERVAREQLGLVKPGEKLFIVAKPSSSDAVQVKKRQGKPVEIGD